MKNTTDSNLSQQDTGNGRSEFASTDWLGRATKEEASLLLFLETCAVDRGGRINTAHLNAQDMEIAKRWNAAGFVSFGRIASEDVNQYGSHWCNLSETAWEVVGEARRARAMRMWGARKYTTTEEKRERPSDSSSATRGEAGEKP